MAEKTKRPPSDGWKELKYSLVLPLLTIAVFLGVWELASRLGLVSASLLPAPSQLARTFAEKLYQTEPDGATLGQSILSSLKTSFSGFCWRWWWGCRWGCSWAFMSRWTGS